MYYIHKVDRSYICLCLVIVMCEHVLLLCRIHICMYGYDIM